MQKAERLSFAIYLNVRRGRCLPAVLTLICLVSLQFYSAKAGSIELNFNTKISPGIEGLAKYAEITSEISQAGRDLDHDGISDTSEQELAEKFAPIIFHDPDEPNLPANVTSFLSKSDLWFYDEKCRPPTVKVVTGPLDIIPHRHQAPCTAADNEFDSEGSRSRNKERTFFLATVSDVLGKASCDSRDWTTYFHAYPNEISGITIQYWRFYTYNTGYVLGFHTRIGSHGGDWEAVHIVLDRNYAPVKARFLGHRSIVERRWAELITLGNHLLFRSEKGGHTSTPVDTTDQRHSQNFIRQETWSGGHVFWPSRHRSCQEIPLSGDSGNLVNLGEKLFPLPGMDFIRYSGLWGTRETGGILSRLRSGYWGPAFNETGIEKDGFITAWCKGMKSPEVQSVKVGLLGECYPTRSNR